MKKHFLPHSLLLALLSALLVSSCGDTGDLSRPSFTGVVVSNGQRLIPSSGAFSEGLWQDTGLLLVEVTDGGTAGFQAHDLFVIAVDQIQSEDGCPALSDGDYVVVECDPTADMLPSDPPQLGLVYQVSKAQAPSGSQSFSLEHWTGTVTDVFTEGSGADLAQVVALEVANHGLMYFTMTENTACFPASAEPEPLESMEVNDMWIGTQVEIWCKAFQDSGYHPILALSRVGDAVLSAPPALTVSCGASSVETLRGGYSWVVTQPDGTSQATIADSLHPLQCRDLAPSLPLLPSPQLNPFTACLQFGVLPDSVTVRSWNFDDWGNPEAESRTLEVVLSETGLVNSGFPLQYEFDLPDGDYIYELSAEWSRSVQYSGTASYIFYTTKSSFQSYDWAQSIGEVVQVEP